MNQKSKQYGVMRYGIVMIIAILVCLGGYVSNIVQLLGMNFSDPVTVELVLRAVGVFLFPIGIIMGFL